MILACAALIGALCVPPQYEAVAQFSSLLVSTTPSKFDPAAVRRTQTHILFWSSDQIVDGSSIGMDRVCRDGWCVYYRRHCGPYGKTCSATLSDGVAEAGDPIRPLTFDAGFEIHAPTRAAMRRILLAVKLTLHWNRDGTATAVPLAELRAESATGNIVGCSQIVWFEGCAKPLFPRGRRPEHL